MYLNLCRAILIVRLLKVIRFRAEGFVKQLLNLRVFDSNGKSNVHASATLEHEAHRS